MVNLEVHVLKGKLMGEGHESTCNVTLRAERHGYYTNAAIVDASVSPRLEDGDYEFH